MQKNFIDNPRSVKFHVKKYLHSNKGQFIGKKVVDFPAGNGVTTKILSDIGAIPLAFDLFPEYFSVEGIECNRANIMEGIPLENGSVDAVICQEGIEHFPDQLKALSNINRVIVQGGILLITTPNYSNLSSRLSYFLSESERFNSILPPNEADSIWMKDQTTNGEIYYGHIFLIGIQKLRLLALLAGFKLKRIIPSRKKSTAIYLFPLFYPFILISNSITYLKNIRKNKYRGQVVLSTYKEVFKLALNCRILLDSHLIIEFEKVSECNQVSKNLMSMHKGFGLT
jgi:SAM-dependent methyltransferase